MEWNAMTEDPDLGSRIEDLVIWRTLCVCVVSGFWTWIQIQVLLRFFHPLFFIFQDGWLKARKPGCCAAAAQGHRLWFVVTRKLQKCDLSSILFNIVSSKAINSIWSPNNALQIFATSASSFATTGTSTSSCTFERSSDIFVISWAKRFQIRACRDPNIPPFLFGNPKQQPAWLKVVKPLICVWNFWFYFHWRPYLLLLIPID